MEKISNVLADLITPRTQPANRSRASAVAGPKKKLPIYEHLANLLDTMLDFLEVERDLEKQKAKRAALDADWKAYVKRHRAFYNYDTYENKFLSRLDSCLQERIKLAEAKAAATDRDRQRSML